ELFADLATMGDYGAQTTVFLTADHGRSNGFVGHGGDAPESARIFLLAAGGSVPARGLVSARRTRHLADITPTVRGLLGLAADVGPGAGTPLSEIVGDCGMVAGAGPLRAALSTP